MLPHGVHYATNSMKHDAMKSTSVPDISFAGVEKRYATDGRTLPAVDQTDLLIRGGEFLVLLGPSGCGKTTMLRMIAGLVQPSAGSIKIGPHELWNGDRRNSAATKDLGVVFQDANLFPWFSVENNIALPLKMRGVEKKQRLARARKLCDLVGIGGFEAAWPRQLSGGMRQRAAIARALSDDPDILLMDEPFGALDAITRDQLNLEIQRIWLKQECTVVFVTHSIPEAVFLADRILLLSPRPGRIDTIVEVPFSRPRSVEIQGEPEFQDIVRQLRDRLEAIIA
jgi:NitT/TauT family transport system ATP-binding protein